MLLLSNLMSSTGNSYTHKELTTADKIKKLKTVLPKNQIFGMAKMIDTTARKYNISPDIFISIIKTESNFNQQAVSATGDISIAQINVNVWNREFKRLNMKTIDQKKLKKSSRYAIQTMGEILNLLKSRYAKNDPKWFARYHSNTAKHKSVYLTKLTQHKKMFASNLVLVR